MLLGLVCIFKDDKLFTVGRQRGSAWEWIRVFFGKRERCLLEWGISRLFWRLLIFSVCGNRHARFGSTRSHVSEPSACLLSSFWFSNSDAASTCWFPFWSRVSFRWELFLVVTIEYAELHEIETEVKLPRMVYSIGQHCRLTKTMLMSFTVTIRTWKWWHDDHHRLRRWDCYSWPLSILKFLRKCTLLFQILVTAARFG